MVEIALTIAGAMALGAVVGIIAGMLGVGGGTVLLPAFRLLFGMSAVGCTATSLFTIIPTSVSGAVSHVRNKTCLPKLGVLMGIGGALTSWIGARLAHVSPSWCIMLAAAAAIGYSAVTMFRKALAVPKQGERSAERPAAASGQAKSGAESPTTIPERTGRTASAAAAPDTSGPSSGSSQGAMPQSDTKHYVLAVVIGSIAGLASGYIGLGGGFLMIPMMLSLMHLPMKLTSGTSLIAIMILALPATVVQCYLGNVDLLVGIAVACGSIPGAAYGAKLTSRVPERALRFAFSFLLLFGAVMLVVKEAGLI